MSHRQLRDFVEILRVLNFPDHVSVEGFRAADFGLVARIATWLAKRLEPNAQFDEDVSTEEARVALVRQLIQTVSAKCSAKLNGKKLYSADGHAVQELLKVAKVLYEAARLGASTTTEADEVADEILANQTQIMVKLGEIKKSRQLAAEITQRGSTLHSLLGQEMKLRQQRSLALTKQLELSQLERAMSDAIRELKEKTNFIHNKMENVSSDEASLDAKIEKKRAELDRTQKRLNSLKSIRPPFMDEFEKLEQDLIVLYDLYVTRMRCLAFLEQQQEEIENAELERIEQREAQVKKMVDQMKQEELLRSQSHESNGDGEEEEEEELRQEVARLAAGDKDKTAQATRQESSARNDKTQRALPTGRIRVFGAMGGKGGESIDSDLDLADEDEDQSELDSEDEMELINLAKNSASKGEARKGGKGPQAAAKTAAATQPNKSGNGNGNESDNDF